VEGFWGTSATRAGFTGMGMLTETFTSVGTCETIDTSGIEDRWFYFAVRQKNNCGAGDYSAVEVVERIKPPRPIMRCDPFDPFSDCFHDFQLQAAPDADARIEDVPFTPGPEDEVDIPFVPRREELLPPIPLSTLPPPAAHTVPQAPGSLDLDLNGSRWFDNSFPPVEEPEPDYNEQYGAQSSRIDTSRSLVGCAVDIVWDPAARPDCISQVVEVQTAEGSFSSVNLGCAREPTSQSCTVPDTVLKASPYNLSEGDIIFARVSFTYPNWVVNYQPNTYGTSLGATPGKISEIYFL
jgi:hypothetical protein